MQKKKVLLLIIFILLFIGLWAAYELLIRPVNTPKEKFLYIPSNTNYKQLKELLAKKEIINNGFWFNSAAKAIGFEKVIPGKYETKGNIVQLIRRLRNGQQTPVNFVVTKIRTKEVLAGRLARSFEIDSLQAISFLNNNDSLKRLNADTNTIMALVMPYTYDLKWTAPLSVILENFANSYNRFWTEKRREQASSIGLTPMQISILASIVDEETNKESDKPNVASVYINRYKKNMLLQADPTVKFALKDFSIRRVLHAHLTAESPYNTYRNKGLPPGPICTPQLSTLDSVLNAPQTDYLFFVANHNFDGTHIFTTNYTDHLKYARLFQQELNKRNIKK